MAGVSFSRLLWPEGVERTLAPVDGRQRSRVRTGVAHVLTALDLLATVTGWQTSSIVLTFEKEGWGTQTGDSGAAIWFMWGDAQRCVTCDLYTSQGANLSAIAQILQSCVAEYNRGSIAAVSHALASYTPSTPSPPDTVPLGHWSETLGISQSASQADIQAAFRRQALKAHPDQGGTREEWDKVMNAFEQARLSPGTRHTAQDLWPMAPMTDEEAVWSQLFPDPVPEVGPD